MFRDLLTTYKLGWKTSYYHNTYDMKGEDEDTLDKVQEPVLQLEQINDDDSEACEACTI
jgi:ribonucleoside-diphosphate reductase alpha chain